MSLLNDALRKKRSELQPAGEPLAPLSMQSGAKSKRRRRWMVVLCSLALAAVIGMVGWYAFATGAACGPTIASPGADLTEARADDPEERQTADNPVIDMVAGPPATSGRLAPEAADWRARPGDNRRDQNHHEVDSAPAPQYSAANSMGPSKVKVAGKPASKNGDDPPRRLPKRNIRDTASAAPAADPAQAKNHPQIDRLYQKARQYHRRSRLNEAIALYQEVLKAQPLHAKARINLVAAYLQIEAYAKAYPMAAELNREEPNNQQIMLNLAIAQIGCGRFQEAIALLDEAAERPDAVLFEIAFHKAVAYRQLNQMQNALTWYKRAEAMRPDDPGLLFNLAVAYDQQQQYGEAVDYYLKYIEHGEEPDPLKIKKIRARVRILQAYHEQEKFKE